MTASLSDGLEPPSTTTYGRSGFSVRPTVVKLSEMRLPAPAPATNGNSLLTTAPSEAAARRAWATRSAGICA